MDWSTYYNMMSMGNYGYPMMGYQNPYQNWNMPVWNYQNPYYYGGNNVSFKGNEDKTQAAAAQMEQSKAKTETAKAELKEYVGILKDGTLTKSNIYEGSPEKIAEYKKEYKRKENNREIAEWATFIGVTALGVLAGPKIAKALKLKPDTWFGDMASNDKVIKYITSGVNAAILGAAGAFCIEQSDGWKKDLKEKYDLKQLDAVA